MTFYADMQITAQAMLLEFGQVVTLIKEAVTFNAADGTSASVPTNYQVSAASYPYKTKDVNGTDIQEGDIQLLMAANSTTNVLLPAPIKGDRISIAGTIWKVIAVEILGPGTIDVMYTLQIRK